MICYAPSSHSQLRRCVLSMVLITCQARDCVGDALRYATKHRSSWYVPQRGLYDLQIVSDHWYWPPTSFTRKGILASLAASCHVTSRISTPKMVSRLSYDYLPNASGFNSGQTLNGHNHIAVICNKVTLWIFKIKPYLTTTLICL